jgi:hypothetical protein
MRLCKDVAALSFLVLVIARSLLTLFLWYLSVLARPAYEYVSIAPGWGDCMQQWGVSESQTNSQSQMGLPRRVSRLHKVSYFFVFAFPLLLIKTTYRIHNGTD